MNVICPHCQQNFEMELETPEEKVVTPIPSTVDVLTLNTELDNLRFENQRLQIINHYKQNS